MIGWEHVTHLSELEKRCASKWLKPIDPSKMTVNPSGMIIGERPGASTSGKLPLFPYPKNSSGGRLFKYANMPIEVYLGNIRRMNLFSFYDNTWNARAAQLTAMEIHDSLVPNDRVVLCGKRVGIAFGFERYGEVGSIPHKSGGVVCYCTIPHPSGLNHLYNNPLAIKAAEIALHWAAGYRLVQKEE